MKQSSVADVTVYKIFVIDILRRLQ